MITISCVVDVTILCVLRTQPDVWVKFVMFLNFDIFFLENLLLVTRTVTVHCSQISKKRALIIHLSVLKTFTKQLRIATFIFVMLFVRRFVGSSVSFSLSASSNIVPEWKRSHEIVFSEFLIQFFHEFTFSYLSKLLKLTWNVLTFSTISHRPGYTCINTIYRRLLGNVDNPNVTFDITQESIRVDPSFECIEGLLHVSTSKCHLQGIYKHIISHVQDLSVALAVLCQ